MNIIYKSVYLYKLNERFIAPKHARVEEKSTRKVNGISV